MQLFNLAGQRLVQLLAEIDNLNVIFGIRRLRRIQSLGQHRHLQPQRRQLLVQQVHLIQRRFAHLRLGREFGLAVV